MLLPSTIQQLRRESKSQEALLPRAQSSLTVSSGDEEDRGGNGDGDGVAEPRGHHRSGSGLSYASAASSAAADFGDSSAPHLRQHRHSRTMSGEVKFADDLIDGGGGGGGGGGEAFFAPPPPPPPPSSSGSKLPPTPRRHHRRSRSAREAGGSEMAPLLPPSQSSSRRENQPPDSAPPPSVPRPKSILRSSSTENMGAMQSILRSRVAQGGRGGRGHARTGSAPDSSLVPFLQSSSGAAAGRGGVGGRSAPPSSSSSSRHHRRARSAQALPLTKEDEVHDGSEELHSSPSVWEATEALHYKPIRSSGIGSSSSRPSPKKKASSGAGGAAAAALAAAGRAAGGDRHRRTRSAGGGGGTTTSTSLLLEAYRQEALGYGAMASQGSTVPSAAAFGRGGGGGGSGSRSPSPMGDSGRPRHPRSLVRVVSSEDLGGQARRGAAAAARPEFRRSKTSDGLPPVSPRAVPPRRRMDSSDGDAGPSGRQRLDSEGSVASSVKFMVEEATPPPHPQTLNSGADHPSLFVFDTAQIAARDNSGSNFVARPHHRRMTSGSSVLSAATAGTDMSVASHRSDITKSSLFRGVTDTGQVELHLPMDNIRLVIDDTLEPGTVYKFRERDEDEMFQEYHTVTDDPDEYLLDENPHLSCACACDRCRMCHQKKQRLLPDVRYVIAVDDDLNKRVLSEISASVALPCGLYYCMRDEHAGRPSAWIAGAIVAAVFVAILVATVVWGGA